MAASSDCRPLAPPRSMCRQHNGSMQRLVEQPADEGDMFGGAARLGRVHYHLSVYQQFSTAEGEPVPEHFAVEGRITPLERIDLAALHQQAVELTLHLAHG